MQSLAAKRGAGNSSVALTFNVGRSRRPAPEQHRSARHLISHERK